jgi:aerobic C4-dicarboxylate transport protein
MKKVCSLLTFQVLVAILLGILTGVFFPGFSSNAKSLSQLYINLINLLIAPVIFLTIVLGIVQMKDLKKAARVGGKALVYFEVVTTITIIIGMVVSFIVKPGEGFTMYPDQPSFQNNLSSGATTSLNWQDFLMHIVPHNLVGAFVEGNILQIIFLAVFFGIGISKVGESGELLVRSFERISLVLFQILKFVLRFAPIGAFGGMAFTVGSYGIQSLLPMGKLMIAVYGTMVFFIFGVLNFFCSMYQFSLWKYLKFIKQEILIVLGTSSSESVLPSMIKKMQQLGCSQSVAGLVIPTGYSFNLDGTSIYLSMAVVFLAQAFKIELSLAKQLSILGVLMITSKGAAAVSGGGFVVLASTLSVLKVIPVESMAILLGVDRFMSEARAITNLIGNGVATIIVAKSEGEFDITKYQDAIKGK